MGVIKRDADGNKIYKKVRTKANENMPENLPNKNLDEILALAKGQLPVGSNNEAIIRKAVKMEIPEDKSQLHMKTPDGVMRYKIPPKALEARNRFVVKELRKGKSKAEVIEELQEEFKISMKQAQKTLNGTFCWLTRDIVDNPKLQCQMLSVQLLRAEELYSRCIAEKKYKDAATSLEIINKLMKLYSPDVTLFQQNNIISNAESANQVVKFRFGGSEVEVGPKVPEQTKETKFVEISKEEAKNLGNIENTLYGEKLPEDSHLDDKDMEELKLYNKKYKDSYFK